MSQSQTSQTLQTSSQINSTQNAPKKRLLVSNDDSINSYFLRVLVEHLVPHFEVIVAAPAQEQSWISKAFTRLGKIKIESKQDWPCPAWSIDGRPADCVNIALNHLCPQPIDAVISGINLGYNITLPLLLSSGTIAAATEGALQGKTAIALSLEISGEDFEEVRINHGKRSDQGNQYTAMAAQRSVSLITDILNQAQPKYSVYTINYPANVSIDMPVVESNLAVCGMPSLFRPTSSDPNTFVFHFPKDWDETLAKEIAQNPQPSQSDFHVVGSGKISKALIQWGKLGDY
jgi:5'-nucleotidase